jgi:hypothetical protein
VKEPDPYDILLNTMNKVHTNARPGLSHVDRFDMMDALEPASIAAELRRESTFHGRATFAKPALLRRLHFNADGIPKTIVCSESDFDDDKCIAVRRFGVESFSKLVVSLTRSHRDFHKFDESELCECTSNSKRDRFERGIRSSSSDTSLNLSPSPISDVQYSSRQQKYCHCGIERSDRSDDHMQCHHLHASRQESGSGWSGRSKRNLQPIGAFGMDASFAGNEFKITTGACTPNQGLLSKSAVSTTQQNNGSHSQPVHVVKHPMNEFAPSNRSCRVAAGGRQPGQRIPVEVEMDVGMSSENSRKLFRRVNLPLMALSESQTTILASATVSGSRAQMYGTATNSRRFVVNERERSQNGELAKCGRSKMSRSAPSSRSTRIFDESETRSNFKLDASHIEYKRLYNESDRINEAKSSSEASLLHPMEEKLLVKAKSCHQMPRSGKGQVRTKYVAKYMDSLIALTGPEVYQ